MMKFFFHDNLDTVALCKHCQRGMCKDCNHSVVAVATCGSDICVTETKNLLMMNSKAFEHFYKIDDILKNSSTTFYRKRTVNLLFGLVFFICGVITNFINYRLLGITQFSNYTGSIFFIIFSSVFLYASDLKTIFKFKL